MMGSKVLLRTTFLGPLVLDLLFVVAGRYARN